MKKFGAAVLALLMLAPALAFAAGSSYQKGDSGADVVLLQQRLSDLGYVAFRATGKFGDMTKTGVFNFQSRNKLSANGVVDDKTYDALFSTSPVRAALNPGITRLVGPGMAALPEEYGELIDWAEADKLLPLDAEATITDLNTGKEYRVRRTGGSNHADVQTVDAASTKTFLECFGGDYTWEKRSCLVEISGKKYAASIFGTPNENNKIPESNMPGSVCLYFAGSKSDVFGIVDEEHNASVLRAANPA